VTSPEQIRDDLKLSEDLQLLPAEKILLAGTRFEALALQSASPGLSDHHLAAARAAFNRISWLKDENNKYPTRAELAANYNLLLMPLIHPLVVDKNLPDLDAVSLVHHGLLNQLIEDGADIGDKIDNDFKLIDQQTRGAVELNKNNPSESKNAFLQAIENAKVNKINRTSQELAAVISVYSIISLLQYWEINILGSRSTLALPTFINKPLNQITNTGEFESQGHVTIFFQQEPESMPLRDRGIYVEAGSIGRLATRLDRDVAAISIRDDMKISKFDKPNPMRIIGELHQGHTAHIHQRIDKLLGILDERAVSSL
jgi:hypothetical protein